MLLVAATFFMEILDGTILATAAPRIARSFAVAPPQIAVTMTGYLVTLAVLIPLSGWLADRFGARTIFVSAHRRVHRRVGAVRGRVSRCWNYGASRVLQGVGGAMMVPVGRPSCCAATGKADLLAAIAFLTWPALLAPIVAPLLGGLITT